MLTPDLLRPAISLPEDFASDTPPEYTFLFCDLMTDQLLAELPMQGVTFSWELNGIGTLRGVVPINDDTTPQNPIGATQPRRTVVYVERDGVPLWGGIIWTRTRAPGGVEIQAAELLSYYQHRRLTTDTLSTDPAVASGSAYVPAGSRLHADQRQMVGDLLTWCARWQGTPSFDLQYLLDPCGVTRDRTYPGSAEFPVVYDLILALSQVENGFDFGLDLGYYPTTPGGYPPVRYRRVRVYYPRRGRTADVSHLSWWHGPEGNLIDYEWPEDATGTATRTWALGDSEGLWAWARDGDLINGGEPLLETVATYSGVTQTATLLEHAQADLAASRLAAVAPTFTVSATADPPLGTYEVGDEATFSIDPGVDPRWPDGMSAIWRIVSAEVTVPDGGGAETVKLTVGAPFDA